ncbi:MAG: hypothetical protein K8L99_29455 [Anaerolineae bacterium]|nr:hypothetical protein [Anaerolineae bacterium]
MTPTIPELYSTIQSLGIIFLIISLVLFYFAVRVGRGLIAMFVNRRPVTRDIDLAKHPVPETVYRLAHQLEALDMQLIGVLHSRFWLLGEGYTWIYLHPDGTVYAELTDILNGLAAFDTWYTDNAHIHTSLRIGENIQLPNLHMRFAAHSLEAAYTYHRDQMNRFEAAHGSPVQIQHMSDILAFGKPFHERYRDRMNQRHKRLASINFGICVVLGMDFLILAVQSMSDPPVLATAFGLGFHAVLWAGSVGLGLYVERQLKSPPGAIDG